MQPDADFSVFRVAPAVVPAVVGCFAVKSGGFDADETVGANIGVLILILQTWLGVSMSMT